VPSRRYARTVAVARWAGPLAAVALVAVGWLVLRADPAAGDCPADEKELEVVEGPRGWSANAFYASWRDGPDCRAETTVALWAPGETWEDEAWAPAARIPLGTGPIEGPAQARAWLAWHPGGLAVAFGTGARRTWLLHVDRFPSRERGGLFHVCTEDDPPFDDDGRLDWDALPEPDLDECERVRTSAE